LEQAYELTGPQALDFHEVAAALSRATGRPVSYVDSTPEQAQPRFEAGKPGWDRYHIPGPGNPTYVLSVDASRTGFIDRTVAIPAPNTPDPTGDSVAEAPPADIGQEGHPARRGRVRGGRSRWRSFPRTT
jgi:hypothetical protein